MEGAFHLDCTLKDRVTSYNVTVLITKLHFTYNIDTVQPVADFMFIGYDRRIWLDYCNIPIVFYESDKQVKLIFFMEYKRKP